MVIRVASNLGRVRYTLTEQMDKLLPPLAFVGSVWASREGTLHDCIQDAARILAIKRNSYNGTYFLWRWFSY